MGKIDLVRSRHFSVPPPGFNNSLPEEHAFSQMTVCLFLFLFFCHCVLRAPSGFPQLLENLAWSPFFSCIHTDDPTCWLYCSWTYLQCFLFLFSYPPAGKPFRFIIVRTTASWILNYEILFLNQFLYLLLKMNLGLDSDL